MVNFGDISMSLDQEVIQEKIILATITCIEKEGIAGVTIRKIANEANVNSAAISYYFGSKDVLIDAALKQTLKEAFVTNLKEKLEQTGNNYKRAFRAFLVELLWGMHEYPGLTKAHFHEPLIHNNYRGLIIKKFTIFLDDLTEMAKEVLSEQKDEKMKIAIVQIISALMLPGLMPKLFYKFSGLDFSKSEDREKYVDELLGHYLE